MQVEWTGLDRLFRAAIVTDCGLSACSHTEDSRWPGQSPLQPPPACSAASRPGSCYNADALSASLLSRLYQNERGVQQNGSTTASAG